MKIGEKIDYALTGVGKLAKSITAGTLDVADKTAKFAVAIFNVISTFLQHFAANAVKAIAFITNSEKLPFKQFIDFVDLIAPIGALRHVLDADERKKLAGKPLKIAHTVAIAAGQIVGSVNILNKYEAINLGAIASTTVGNMPVLGFVKNTLFTVGTGFNIAEGIRILAKECPAKKVEVTKNVNKINTLSNEAIIAKAGHNPDYDTSLIDDNKQAFVDSKKALWKAKAYNAGITQRKAVIGLIADIAKIAILILSTVALAFALTNPILWLIIPVIGLASASTGFFKSLYTEYFCEVKQLPQVAFKTA